MKSLWGIFCLQMLCESRVLGEFTNFIKILEILQQGICVLGQNLNEISINVVLSNLSGSRLVRTLTDRPVRVHSTIMCTKDPTIYNIICWFAVSLVCWDKWLVDQASDVPSIFFFMISCKILCKNGFNVFLNEFTEIKTKTLGRRVIRSSDLANQHIIL